MLRSHPPPLIHASELFKFGLDLPRQSSSPVDAISDEVQSVQSAADDESVTSERSSSLDDCEDRPLNLTCKRRRLETADTERSNDSRCAPMLPNGYEGLIKPAQTTYLPNDVIERAMLHYRAQVIASNDLVRAFLQQKWNERAAAAATQPRLPATAGFAPHLHPAVERISSWVPLIGGLGQYEAAKRAEARPGLGEHKRLCPSNSADSESSRSSVIMRRGSPYPASGSPPCSPPLYTPSESAPFSPTLVSPRYIMHAQSPGSQARFSPPTLYSDLADRHQKTANSVAANDTPSSLLERNKATKKRQKSKKGPGGHDSSTGGDSYPCAICGASYPHKFELNRHVKVSHVRPHRCGQCGKGFGHRNYLKVHIETVHMGRKTHQCRLCGKYLSTGGNLNVHVRTIHLGEKKYNCPVCNRSFGQQCNMKTHMKRHFSKADDI